MSQAMTLNQLRFREGVWEGILIGHPGAQSPDLIAYHMDRTLDDLRVDPADAGDGSWWVRVRIPAECLNEGVQSFVIQDNTSGEALTHFTISAGTEADDDLAAEVALLRAELDMLKRVVRRLR